VRAAKDGFFAVLAAEIGESPIPYDVYLVDLRYADPALLDDVPRKGVKWWSEHKTADWIIDLGPEGGDAGGYIVASGTPEDIASREESYTGQYLRPYLARRIARRRRAG